jgi:DNA-binding NarL/FixJ family response regulator
MTPSQHTDDQPPSPASTIVIVDDHELFATSLLYALREAGLEATTLPVSHVSDLLGPATVDNPGLLLLDLNLGAREVTGGRTRLKGEELVAEFRQQGWRVLVITGSEDESQIAAAIAGGALGVVDKTDGLDHLLAAASTASTGQSLIADAERARWVVLHDRHRSAQRDRAERLSKLTPREREVLELIADGYRAAAIAHKLVVSISTVRAQIRSILVKTRSNSQMEAVALIRPRVT